MSHNTTNLPTEPYEVLNEQVIRHESHATSCCLNLDSFPIDNHVYVCSIIADELCVATFYTCPYCLLQMLVVYGPLMHTNTHAIMVTPICPQCLSSGLLVLPETVVFRISLPNDSHQQ